MPGTETELLEVTPEAFGELADVPEYVEPDEPAVTDPGVAKPVIKPADLIAAPIAPVPAVAPPAPAPAPVAPVPVPPAAPMPPAAPVAPVAQPEAPAPAPATDQPMSTEQLLAHREQLITDISSRYLVSPEQREMLLTEPEKVLPGMAARIAVDTYDMVFHAVTSQLPRLIQAINQNESTAKGHETSFFDRWPALNKPEYKSALLRLAAAYRQANPTATPAQALEEIGAQAHFALRLPLEGMMAGNPAPVLAPQQRPFVPAAPGGAPAATPRSGGLPGNIFTELAQDEY